MFEWTCLFDGLFFSLCFFTCLVLCTKKSIPLISPKISLLLAIVAVLLLGFTPADAGRAVDRESYVRMFTVISQESKDYGFNFYVKLCRLFFDKNVQLFFILTALIYVYGHYYFVKKGIKTKYVYYVLILFFVSLGFQQYNINTLRAGFALSILLIAMAKGQSFFFFLLLSVFSVLIHKSALLPAVAFMGTAAVRDTKFYYILWVTMLLCLLIGLFDNLVSTFSFLIESEADERIGGYLSVTESVRYQTGLRLDFISYSFFPIIVGWYYIYKCSYTDTYFIRLYHTYILCNSFWLIVSKIAFSDRFATLSWFLIPMLLLYPLLSKSSIPYKTFKLSGLMLVVSTLSFILTYLR